MCSFHDHWSWSNPCCDFRHFILMSFWQFCGLSHPDHPFYVVFVGGQSKTELSFFVIFVFISQWLSQFSRTSGSFRSRLPLPVSLSTPMQGLFFSLPLSFLLSHLVTRPLERSVKFPLSQRRGQSEPHKDPQWEPLCSLLPPSCCCSCTHALTGWII